jgi:hypothetical protein
MPSERPRSPLATTASRAAEAPTYLRAWMWIGAAAAAWVALGVGATSLLGPRLAPGSAAARVVDFWGGHLVDGVLILAVLAGVAALLWRLQPPRLRRWVPAATAEGLGVIRAWIAAILLANVLWEDVASTAHLPREMLRFQGQWLVELLHGTPAGAAFLASEPALRTLEVATALLLVLAMVGLFTRWTVPAAAVAFLLCASILRSYAWFYHTGLVPLYALLLLSFTPCGDGFSLDRVLRRRSGRELPPDDVPRLRYGLGRWLVWMAIALPYTLAGLSKLRRGGFLWWRGDLMEHRLVAALLEPMHFDFEVTFLLIRGPEWIFAALGIAALVGEITFVGVLVSTWARRILPAMMAGMHVGILLLQNIFFPDLIAIQAVFYDWNPLRRRVASWFGRARHVASAAWSAPPRATASIARRQLLVARGFLVVAFVAWASRTEEFPFTAMQMFARSEAPEPVTYVRPMVVYEDGSRERARFERWVGAMADSRYRWLLRDWPRDPAAHGGEVALLRDFLDVVAQRSLSLDAPGHRIRGFELEVRRWDYRLEPAHPGRGDLLYVLRHPSAPADGSTAGLP